MQNDNFDFDFQMPEMNFEMPDMKFDMPDMNFKMPAFEEKKPSQAADINAAEINIQKKLRPDKKRFSFSEWTEDRINYMRGAQAKREERFRQEQKQRDIDAIKNADDRIKAEAIRYTELAKHRAEAIKEFLKSEAEKAQEDAKKLKRHKWQRR